MRNRPKQYVGYEITPDLIAKIKSISIQRYDSLIYQDYFEEIQTVEDLARMHDIKAKDEILILGEDWFISYSQQPIELEVLEWVALDNIENKMAQIREMLNTLKYILYLSRTTCLSAHLRHDTSYRFYQMGIRRGIIKPAIDEAFVDYYHPEEMEQIVDELERKYKNLDNFFDSEEKDSYPEYEQYILHRVVFTVTKNFVKQYKKSQKQKS
jgi:hypothetical protein